jgi:hypothetical protein
MPSPPFCRSCNDTETDYDESHEPISQREYSSSESRGDASVGSVYEDEDEYQAGTEMDQAGMEWRKQRKKRRDRGEVSL